MSNRVIKAKQLLIDKSKFSIFKFKKDRKEKRKVSVNKVFFVILFIIISVSAVLISKYVKPSPYDTPAYCDTCKKITNQRIFFVTFAPELECEICHNANPTSNASENQEDKQ